MIIIEKEKIGHIPVLHLSEQSAFNQELPLIIFIHGFQSAKEHNLHYAYLMAEKGFRVLLPDVIYHGEREVGYSDSQLMPRFWEMVLQTIKDLALIKDDLLARKLIDSKRIGVAGTSMGGIVTNGALAAYDWITVGVSLMGNPSYVAYAELQIEEIKKRKVNFPITDEEVNKVIEKLKPFDLSLNQDKLSNRPLLFWHGAKDPVVPYQHAYRFYEGVKAGYNEAHEKIDFILDQKAGHKVSREGVLRTAEWFEKHLRPAVQKA
ncbi:prolyl oligopeptidase family serine peptidase [Peribacillus butanolivorans]|uniref:Esterase n=1 Tax=Peribacillus butanolivorans TaxID=421767 RepID=A0AAX0S7S0_9BACI|nr:prolyl oligopeptidase family serine peptidase [Peribacillus butanolivorans]AXN40170.1 esterase [Peribacillus butanolivorans]KON68142.1 esterase [Peribacillus butanolivorans]PEJ36888.1 esterase [Peribacillus butanolivorans]QNU05939.1 prolyl oligopeptidase family serine peptidase [Peribacillus butanolivorans]